MAERRNDHPSSSAEPQLWQSCAAAAIARRQRKVVAKFHHAKNGPAAIMDLGRELGSRAPDKASDGAA
jgi:hypothetical protein